MLPTATDVLPHSSGRVHTPESYNYRTYLPEKRGLFCADIFGPVPWKRGDLSAITRDDRSVHWGHIELPESGRIVLVVPPFYRRFRLLSAAEHRQTARARRAELLALDASGGWTACDSVDKILAEEGLDDPDAIEKLEEGATEHPLNSAYRATVNRANRLQRLNELNAPDSVLDETRRLLESGLDLLRVESTRHGLPPGILAPLLASLGPGGH